MSTEQTEKQIHQNLIRANFQKDNNPEAGFAWIAYASNCGYVELQVELIGLHCERYSKDENLRTEDAAILWGRLAVKKAKITNFSQYKTNAKNAGFKFEDGDVTRGGDRANETFYTQASIYRLAKHTVR